MLPYFQEQKEIIKKYLSNFLSRRGRELSAANQWGEDGCSRIFQSASSGKMIRGCLVMLSHRLFGGSFETDAVKIAAALELFQTSLLIHDDIMDRDIVRRGEPSLFYQYRNLGIEQNFGEKAYHFGESMGICLGDLACFLGFELLGNLNPNCPQSGTINALFARELAQVGLGQMQDVYFGYAYEKATDEEILNLYRYKTARYTFSLPLQAGAAIAGSDSRILAALEKMGEDLGIIFQIKDDELGLFGTEKEIGKPVGSDIQEGKMTFSMNRLIRKLNESEKNWLFNLFGKEDPSEKDLQIIRQWMQEKGIIDETLSLCAQWSRSVENALFNLPGTNEEMLAILHEFIRYNTERKK